MTYTPPVPFAVDASPHLRAVLFRTHPQDKLHPEESDLSVHAIDQTSGETCYRWGFFDTPKNQVLIVRLMKAIEAGAVIDQVEHFEREDGSRWAMGRLTFRSRYMNAELKRRGF